MVSRSQNAPAAFAAGALVIQKNNFFCKGKIELALTSGKIIFSSSEHLLGNRSVLVLRMRGSCPEEPVLIFPVTDRFHCILILIRILFPLFLEYDRIEAPLKRLRKIKKAGITGFQKIMDSYIFGQDLIHSVLVSNFDTQSDCQNDTNLR